MTKENQEPAYIKNKHTDDLVDHYWGSINYIFGLVKASEIKAGLILSFYGILLNFIYQHIGEVSSHAYSDVILAILLGAWFVCIVTSIYFSVRCFMPRIEGKHEKNIFFFRDVVTRFGTIKEFAKTFHEISVDEDQLFDQLGQQIFVLSSIASMKFGNVNSSLRFLAFGLILLFVITLYVMFFTLTPSV